MKNGVCPDCESPVTRHWFRVTCDRCLIELKDGPATTALKVGVSIVSFVVGIVIAQKGTPEIIESNPANLKDVLFWFYMKIFLGVAVVSNLANFAIRQWFSTYARKEQNT